jgi:hypothetical protein
MYRAAAARVLRHYKSPANHQRLHRLLSDPGYSVVPAAEWKADRDQRTMRVYPAREQALEYLHEWGIDASTPTAVAGMPYASPDWARLAASFVLIVSFLMLTRRRGSSGVVRRLVIGVSLFFLLVTAILSWRSRYGSDSLAFSIDGTSYELSSAAGRFCILRVDDRSRSAAPAVRSDAVHAPWFDTHFCQPGLRPTSAVAPTYTKLLLPTGEAARAGFAASWGSVVSAGVYPYRLTIVPGTRAAPSAAAGVSQPSGAATI